MSVINPIIERAYKVLSGQELTRAEAIEIAENIHGADILDLVSLANKVRQVFAGKIEPCSIINAKSGRCAQNCRFCAQSAHHNTGVETYALMPKEEVLVAAQTIYDAGVRTFGYVTSGYGYTDTEEPEFKKILETLDYLHTHLPELKICVSIGILSYHCAKALAEHHTWRYNMNLQTNPSRYAELVADTHKVEDKIQTIKFLQEFGVTNCTGGILGLGETWSDRIDMALAIKELGVEGSPLNVLLPIKGTKLENMQVLKPSEIAKAFALFRLINPTKMIKFAAGRETTMKDFQGLLMLSGLNSMIVGGYLTTRGRGIDDDQIFIEQLNDFES